MPFFIKTENFTKSTLNLSLKERQQFLEEHRSWVIKINNLGNKVTSGYLVNEKKLPGGGGFMIIEAKSYAEANSLVIEDPMIKNNLVIWNLQEWVAVAGELTI